MNRYRTILHSDLNSFYSSVEMMLNPALQGKAVAVCGSTEDRHGIVLAKSEKAKKAGVKTEMVNWEAKQRCPDLIIVPPQYDQYLKYSELTRSIYLRYTDLVEPFGMDECWCDVTGCLKSGIEIAEDLTGAKTDYNGVLVATSEDLAPYVAVGFRALRANGKYRYFWLYRVKFATPSTSLATKGDSIAFQTTTIEGTIMRRNKVDGQGNHPWKTEVTEGGKNVTDETITSWFTSVYEPTFAKKK